MEISIATDFPAMVFLMLMWRIPLFDLNYDDAEKSAVLDVLQSRWLTLGPRTEEFEAAMASVLGAKHAIAVANCTCALELAYAYLKMSSTHPGNTILVPDITFVATANAAVAVGLNPLIVDASSPHCPWPHLATITRILDQKQSEIIGVTVMHYAGYDISVEAITDECRRRQIPVIEDVAHAPGASTVTGRSLGTIGHTGCFSFFSNKNLATGEGGMLVTNDDDAAAWYRHTRSHGLTAGTWQRHTAQAAGYDMNHPGRNFRCTEITAALGLAQLAKLSSSNQRRRALLNRYRTHLNTAGLQWLDLQEDVAARGVAHIMPLICRDKAQRNRIRMALSKAGIQSSHHYPPVHSLAWYKEQPHFWSGDLANATEFANREITLPLYPTMPDSAVDEVLATVLQAADA